MDDGLKLWVILLALFAVPAFATDFIIENPDGVAELQINGTTGAQVALGGDQNLPWVIQRDGTTFSILRDSQGITMVQSGALGINTTSPTATLDVAGSARFRTIQNAQGNVLTVSGDGVVQQRTLEQLIEDIGAQEEFNTSDIIQGVGLSISGPLADKLFGEGDVTFNLADTAVTPGVYGGNIQVGRFTVDQQGRITGASNITIRSASASQSGIVTTGSQEFAGAKTFFGTPFTLSANNAVLNFSSSTGTKQIVTGGSTDLALMPGGNVGIGTDNPDAKLHVDGNVLIETTGSDALKVEGSDPVIDFVGTVNNRTIRFHPAQGALDSINTAFHFNRHSGLGVAIGRNSDSRLRVGQAAWELPALVYIGSTINDAPAMIIQGGDDPTQDIFRIRDSDGVTQLAVNNAYDLNVKNDLEVDGDLQVDGNVGIGTDNPDAKLHVAGPGLFEDDLEVDGNIETSGNLVEKYLEFTPTDGVGWYRISTHGGGHHGGTIRIIANYDNTLQNLEFSYVARRYSDSNTIGQINVIRNLNYNAGPVSQIRVGRNEANDRSVLDIYVNRADSPGPIRIWGYGHGVILDDSATFNPSTYVNSAKVLGNLHNRYGFHTTDQIYSLGTNDNFFMGNVGIGTTSPSQQLDVDGRARFRTIDNAQGNILTVSGDGVVQQRTPAQIRDDIDAEGSFDKGDIIQGTGVSLGGTLTERLFGSGDVTVGLADTVVTSGTYGGNIQVGQFTVDQQGRITEASNITIRSASASQSGIVTTGSQTFAGAKQIEKTAHEAGSGNYHLELYSPNTGDSSNEVSLRFHQGSQSWGQIRYRSGGFRFTGGNDDTLITINAGNGYFAGNVGIGTTSPSERLDVDGTARFRTIDNVQGNILTVSGDGVVQQRTPAEIRDDIGAEGAFDKGDIIQGTGVSLGGTLTERLFGSGDVTVGLANTAVTPGVYGGNIQVGQFTVDQQGRITGASNVTIRSASASQSGVVTTGSQTFAGQKTFSGTPFTLSANNAAIHFSSSTGTKQITTAGSTNLALMPGGNVGIGTTSPAAQLHVAGDTLIDGSLTVVGDYINATVTTQFLNGSFMPSLPSNFDIGSNDARWNTVYAEHLNLANALPINQGGTGGVTAAEARANLNVAEADACPSGQVVREVTPTGVVCEPAGTGSGAENRAAFWTGTNALSYDDNFVWDNDYKRLGLGTTSPDTILHLENLNAGGEGPVLKLQNPSSTWHSTASLRFSRNVPSSAGGTDRMGEIVVGSQSASGGRSYMIFQTRRQSQSDVENVMTLWEDRVGIGSIFGDESNTPEARLDVRGDTHISGDLGLGTTNPLARLHVAGDIRVDPGNMITLRGDGSISSGQSHTMLRWHGFDSGHTLDMGYDFGSPYFFETSESARDIEFRNADTGSWIYMAGSSGNVGIGTTSPSEQLDVDGRARFRTIDNAYGNILTVSGDGVVQQRTPAQIRDDIGAEGSFDKGDIVQGTGISLGGTLTERLFGSGDVTVGLANTAVTPGTYGSNIQVGQFTVDQQGRITGANSVTIRSASASQSGVVTTGSQTFAGAKTFFGTPFTLSANNAVLDFSSSTGTKQIVTGGSSDLALMPGGNVGVGTTSPDSPLHVVGNIEATNMILAEEIQLRTPTSFYIRTADGNRRFRLNPTGAAIYDRLAVGTSNPGDAPSGGLYVDGQAWFNDNVGIGTDSPSESLDVDGNIGLSGNIIDTSASNAALRISGTTSSRYLEITTSTTGAHIRGFGNIEDGLRLGAGTSPAISIDADNNVGVRTTSPETVLEVSGGDHTNFDVLRISEGSNPTTRYAQFGSANWEIVRQSGSAIPLTIRTSTPGTFSGQGGDIIFAPDSSEALRIQRGGNVGIGTDSPSAQLQVAGDAIIDGSLTVLGTYINATVTTQFLNGTFLPSMNNQFDIGSTGAQWRNVYANQYYVGTTRKDEYWDAKIGGSGTEGRIARFTAYGTIDDSEIFQSGTDIGIGTTSPDYKLHVVGSGGFSTLTTTSNADIGGRARIHTSTATNPGLTITGNRPNIWMEQEGSTGGIAFALMRAYSTNPDSEIRTQIANFGVLATGGGTGGSATPEARYVYIDARPDGAHNNAALKVDYENRVGIALTGSNRPSYTLHVNGDGRFTDDVYVDERLGVGTTNPQADLHVEGTFRAGQGGSSNPSIDVESNIIRIKI